MKAYILDGEHAEETTRAQVVAEAHRAQRRLWVDLGARSAESDALLRDVFRLHPLVIEDIWLDRELPKLDDLGDYVYLVVHGPRLAPENDGHSRLELWMLDLVIGPTFVISHHDDADLAAAISQELRDSPRLLTEGPIWLAHRMLDRVVDRFLPVIERIGQRLDEIETAVLDVALKSRERDLTPTLFHLKRSIQSLHRIAHRQQDVLARLAEGGSKLLPRATLPYFHDVSDHFIRVADLAQTYQDTVLNVLDAHLSVQSNVMNQAVRRLTVISTVLLPLNVIASIYGMNFSSMPLLAWPHGFAIVLGVMALLAMTTLAWARHRRWL
jgi:magnesium transporter